MKTIKVFGKTYTVDKKYKYIYTAVLSNELVVCMSENKTSDCKVISTGLWGDCLLRGIVPLSKFEVEVEAKTWSFKTNKEPYIAEVFHDLSRSKPIGIVKNDKYDTVTIVIHEYLYCLLPRTLQEDFTKVAGSCCLYVTSCAINDLSWCLDILKSYKQETQEEITYTISYPGAK